MINYNKTAIQQIIWGGALLGSGGGGGIDLALAFLSIIPANASFTVLQQGDAPVPAVVTAFVGAPDALSQPTVQPLLDAFDRFVAQQPATCTVPVETGAVNSIAPFLVALTRNVVIADADGAGRAVPQLTNLVFNDGVPVSPIELSNGQGVATRINVPDAATAEALVRSVVTTAQFGQVGGLALWGMTPAQLQQYVIWGTLETTRQLGAAILNGTTAQGIVDTLNSLGRAANVFATGTFSAGQEQTGGGFDTGRNTVAGANGLVTIYNQNENLISWSDQQGAPLYVAPSSICYWDNQANLPFTNVEAAAKNGRNVSLIHISPLKRLAQSPAAMAGFKNTLLNVGYAGVSRID